MTEQTGQHRINQSARILSGVPVADAIRAQAAAFARLLLSQHGVRPCLAVVRVGDDPASAVYVGSKISACAAVGLTSEHHELPAETSQTELLDLIQQLNGRTDIDGILVQLPLPEGISERTVVESIDPQKDVDGFHPLNVGRLSLGQHVLAPCTPAGIIMLLDHYAVPISGVHAVVVGRSNIVGKPMAQLLLQRDATVTICHSRTRDLGAITRQADILVAALGRAGFITGAHIKPGATVIDVGMNSVSDTSVLAELFGGDELEKRIETVATRGATLVGDVNPLQAASVAGAITPVPRGVGLLTVAMLMKNTIAAACARRGLAL